MRVASFARALARGFVGAVAVHALASAATGTSRAEALRAAGAASLRGPVTEIARTFEATSPGARVELSFGASNVLARQIVEGAPAEVFLSADDASVDVLAAQDLVRPGTRTAFAGNRLVVVASRERAGGVTAPADLAGPAVRRLALAGPGVPAGRYARAWLARAGLLAAVEPRVIVQEDVRAVLAAVDAGNADAGIVYATDARVAKSARVAFVPPDAEQPRIVYEAAGIATARSPALADAFLRHLGGPEAQAILRAAGFLPPPAAGPR